VYVFSRSFYVLTIRLLQLVKEKSKKGIMTKCVKKVLDIGFNIANANKIEIHCATKNVGSNRIVKKIGIKKEGTIRNVEIVNNEINDLNVYGILKSEYLKITT